MEEEPSPSQISKNDQIIKFSLLLRLPGIPSHTYGLISR